MCSVHNSMVYNSKEQFGKREKVCALQNCQNRNCKLILIPTDNANIGYLRMEDAYACIFMHMKTDNKKARSANEDNVRPENLRDIKVYLPHYWMLISEGRGEGGI